MALPLITSGCQSCSPPPVWQSRGLVLFEAVFSDFSLHHPSRPPGCSVFQFDAVASSPFSFAYNTNPPTETDKAWWNHNMFIKLAHFIRMMHDTMETNMEASKWCQNKRNGIYKYKLHLDFNNMIINNEVAKQLLDLKYDVLIWPLQTNHQVTRLNL